jgi:Rha family phage regulatory protein
LRYALIRRKSAEYFLKGHFNVLADIRKLSAELSAEISAVWFQPATCRQKTGFGYRDMPAFDMTRDGFTLLAMGFTGKRALEFKLKYIASSDRHTRIGAIFHSMRQSGN